MSYPVIDCGSTFTSHPAKEDYINFVETEERLEGPDGRLATSIGFGDLPCAAMLTNGELRHFTLKKVRCVPEYNVTLFSINKLWAHHGIDVTFRDVMKVTFPDGKTMDMRWMNGVYVVRLVINPKRRWALGELTEEGKRALVAHSPRAQSHIHKMSPNEAARLMHSRLHLSLSKIKQLCKNSRDAPQSLALATEVECDACTRANARAHSHPEIGYAPSRVGSIIYMDDAGPHNVAALGGVKYFRIFIDAHSRFRLTYLLRARTEGVDATRRFIAEFNSVAGAQNGAQLIQCLHTDNAPEIVSHEFEDLLLKHGIKHVTSPAHIKQPNGIAERAIGTSRAIARSVMTAASAPLWTWGCAILHAEDVLNHCNGPSDSNNCKADGISSYQLLTGQPPNIMKIMTWGCLTVATKPPGVGVKIAFGERGTRTFNLGRSREQPGAFRLWAPTEKKLLVTSDVAFYENHFPWRLHKQPQNYTIDYTAKNTSSIVLNLFSGPYRREDGLTAELQSAGYKVIQIDNSNKDGGGRDNDVLNDYFFNSVRSDAANGKFRCVFAAPPCSTFSISRFFDYKGKDDSDRGPPVLRDKDHILGRPDVAERHLTELRRANAVVHRCAAIIEAVADSGGSFVIENPACRSDPSNPITYMPQLSKHGSLWQMPEIKRIETKYAAETVTFAMCMLGSPWQKYTSLLFSPDLAPSLSYLSKLCCSHTKGEHQLLAGKTDTGEWLSTKAAAYPPKLCQALAGALPPLSSLPENEQINKQTEPDPTTGIPEHSNETEKSTEATQFQALAAPSTGPRPGGGTFNLRRNSGYTGDGQTYQRGAGNPDAVETDPRDTLTNGTNEVCVVVPNSITGRALQAVASPPDYVSPRGRKTALKQDKEGWLKAERKELDSHERNQSWSIIRARDVPTGRRIIKMLWVYKIKRDGTLKARLCVMGSSQRPGVDFDQTYCATMRAASLRLLAAISARLGLSMWRMDFVSAYLQGLLEDGEVVFCLMPEGYETTGTDGKPNVLRIEKPIYGLAQAGRRWQRSLFPWLIKYGFTQSEYDPCVFYIKQTKDKHEEVIILGCYVDDLLVCASHTDNGSLFKAFVKALKKDWEIDDEGEAVDLLNVHFAKTNKGILLHQRPYIETMVAKYAPDGIPLAFQKNWTPCNNDLPELVRRAMSDNINPDKELTKDYQSIVGALLYCATNTRPDIAYAVGMLCRAMSRPTPPLLKAAFRVLHYLARHADVGLHYEADPSAIEAYSDSDLGVQKSTTGWDVRWQKATISFGSKKQTSVATSSCHAEIIAASEAAKEAKFYREFAEELGFKQTAPTRLLVDNTATVDLSYNPEYHSRTKHIDRRHFYVRELVEEHILQVQYVNTADNLADFFTKPLPPKTFFKLRNIIMNMH